MIDIVKQRPRRSTLHPRNRHRDGYDFSALMTIEPALAAFVKPNAYGNDSIDFADPAAVKWLNKALLKQYYAIDFWDIPPGFLCPPVPGRADYIHHLAELIGPQHAVHALDIGTGANLIYPLIGHHEYGWHFVGADINTSALRSAQTIIDHNPRLATAIALRHQPDPLAIFTHIILPGEQFTVSLCNPPFHASTAAASAGTQRKWRNLSRHKQHAATDPVLNFGGQHHELCCEGGEAAFIHRMIKDSAPYQHQVRWFTTLVSKSDNLPSYQRALRKLRATQSRDITMQHGQKTSHILAWSFV